MKITWKSINWIKHEILVYKLFRKYSDMKIALKCKKIYNEILEEEKRLERNRS